MMATTNHKAAFPFGALPSMSEALGDPMQMMNHAWSTLSLPSPFTPTLDPDEINRRITDLKAVETWLMLNLKVLQSTIQGLEIQAGTLEVMRNMRESMGNLGRDSEAAVAQALAQFAQTRARQSQSRACADQPDDPNPYAADFPAGPLWQEMPAPAAVAGGDHAAPDVPATGSVSTASAATGSATPAAATSAASPGVRPTAPFASLPPGFPFPFPWPMPSPQARTPSATAIDASPPTDPARGDAPIGTDGRHREDAADAQAEAASGMPSTGQVDADGDGQAIQPMTGMTPDPMVWWTLLQDSFSNVARAVMANPLTATGDPTDDSSPTHGASGDAGTGRPAATSKSRSRAAAVTSAPASKAAGRSTPRARRTSNGATPDDAASSKGASRRQARTTGRNDGT